MMEGQQKACQNTDGRRFADGQQPILFRASLDEAPQGTACRRTASRAVMTITQWSIDRGLRGQKSTHAVHFAIAHSRFAPMSGNSMQAMGIEFPSSGCARPPSGVAGNPAILVFVWPNWVFGCINQLSAIVDSIHIHLPYRVSIGCSPHTQLRQLD